MSESPRCICIQTFILCDTASCSSCMCPLSLLPLWQQREDDEKQRHAERLHFIPLAKCGSPGLPVPVWDYHGLHGPFLTHQLMLLLRHVPTAKCKVPAQRKSQPPHPNDHLCLCRILVAVSHRQRYWGEPVTAMTRSTNRSLLQVHSNRWSLIALSPQVIGVLENRQSVIQAALTARPNVTAFAYFSSAVNPLLYVFAGSSHIRQAGLSFMGRLFEATNSESRSTSSFARSSRSGSSPDESSVLQTLSVKIGKPFRSKSKGRRSSSRADREATEPELKTLAAVEQVE